MNYHLIVQNKEEFIECAQYHITFSATSQQDYSFKLSNDKNSISITLSIEFKKNTDFILKLKTKKWQCTFALMIWQLYSVTISFEPYDIAEKLYTHDSSKYVEIVLTTKKILNCNLSRTISNIEWKMNYGSEIKKKWLEVFFK